MDNEYFHVVTESSFFGIMYSEFHSTHREKRDHTCASFASTGRLQNIQNNGKPKNCQAKKWSLSLTRGGHLQEVLNCRALTGKVMVFWMGGRSWEVVAHGGSSVVDN